MLQNATEVISTDARGFSSTLRESVWLMALAWAVVVTGGILVCFSLVHAFGALFPGMPLWACYGLVGAPALGLGGVLLLGVRARLASLQPIDAHTAKVAGEMIQIASRVNDVLDATVSSIEKTTGAIRASVESARAATDLRRHVEQRPWAMFAGAAGLGYAGGMLLGGSAANPLHAVRSSYRRGAGGEGPQDAESVAGAGRDDTPASREPGVLDKLGEALAPQAELVRQIAIGALFSLVRDLARDAMPGSLEQPVDDFFNGAAKNFGGRPLARGAFKAPVRAVATEGAPPVA